MKIILSIKPEYADKILDGTKKFEFRKVAFTAGDVRLVVIYATKPVGKVVGEFEVTSVHVDEPQKIWRKTKDHAGIKKSFFDEYYRDRTTAVAIAVGKVRRYETPLELNDLEPGMTAPQSFRYLSTEKQDTQLALAL